MSTVSDWESGPPEMSFRGFVDKTLLHHRCCGSTESQREAVLSSIPPWGTKAVGTKAKSPTGNSSGFMWNLCLEVYSTRMSVCKRPAETHVHDCLKRPQDSCPLNQKIQTRCTYTWEKKNKRMGQRLGKHTMIFRLGSESPWFLYGSVWLVGCFLNNNTTSWSFTVQAGPLSTTAFVLTRVQLQPYD